MQDRDAQFRVDLYAYKKLYNRLKDRKEPKELVIRAFEWLWVTFFMWSQHYFCRNTKRHISSSRVYFINQSVLFFDHFSITSIITASITSNLLFMKQPRAEFEQIHMFCMYLFNILFIKHNFKILNKKYCEYQMHRYNSSSNMLFLGPQTSWASHSVRKGTT